MNTTDDLPTLRRSAELLLKGLRTDRPGRTRRAAVRLRRLPALAGLTLAELRQTAQHKHALDVVALEHGHPHWRALKAAVDAGGPLLGDGDLTALDERLWFDGPAGGFLNHWFATHAQARAHQDLCGGLVLPHQGRFVVVEAPYVQALGLDAEDPDWAAIGHDWAQPADVDALGRLRDRLRQARIEAR
ncbi:MAG: hypothetical protein H6739_24940 [Alphaproteobacteria bacterium]|nr:hypothetical protein [Alphaproteobacteria bacterium]